jgi:anti-anti-sigma regulatory factor
VSWAAEVGRTTVSLKGEIDADSRDDLVAIGVVADLAPTLVIDLTGVSFVDLVGLDQLEQLLARPNVTLDGASSSIVKLLGRTEEVLAGWPALREAAGYPGSA